MRTRLKRLATLLILLSICSTLSQAEDRKYTLHFGKVITDPSSGATIPGDSADLGIATGGELNFEWYFTPVWSVDFSSITAVNIKETNNDRTNGMAIRPFSAGINDHAVSTSTIDWSLGLLMGGTTYKRFIVEGDPFSTMREHDSSYGLQTSLDLAPDSWSHWRFSLGAKYLKPIAELKGMQREININSIIGSSILIYNW